MQSALAWSPLDRRHFLYYPSQLQHKRIASDLLAPIGAVPASTAVSPQQYLRKVPAVPSEPSAAQGLQAPVGNCSVTYTGVSDYIQSFREGMTGLLTKHSSPGSQAKESGALMAGGAGREDDWQMPCLEPSPERRSVRSAAKRWGPRSPEMPMLVPAVSKGPAEEAEEVVSRQTQLLLSRFQGSVEVDSIDGLDFFSFSSVEDLNEFARSMDQLLEEQYHEPRSPDESVPSSVARSGAADEEWRETDWTEERQPVVVLPRKTTDITKIKGWRRKAFGPDQTADQAADHTTRWVMDQMNEQAWRQEEEEKQEPPALMTRRATAAAAAAAAAASGGQQSASNQAAPQPEARIMIDKVKQENVQAAEVSLSKGVRCAFLSSKLDEFLQHQSELRVGQLAQFNPNILPLPEGQGVLALRNPVLASQPPEGPSRQVGPTRQMTARPSRRYGRPRAAETARASGVARTEHWKTSVTPAARRRRQGSAATDKAAEELEAPSPSPSKPIAAAATGVDSLPKPPAKRVKTEAEEDPPFLAMTSRKLRGGQVTPDSSLNKAAAVPKEGAKRKEPSTAKEASTTKEAFTTKEASTSKEPCTPKDTSRKRECTANPVTPSKSTGAAATKKTAAAAPLPAEEPLPYGAYEDSGDYPIVPETQFTSEQKRLLQALLASTQCSRPLTVALPVEPCFVCPQLDQHDALAAARALSPAEDGTCRKTSTTSGKPGTPSPATAGQKTTQTHTTSTPKGANVVKKGRPLIKAAVTKESTVDMSKTPRKLKVKALSIPAIPASPTESTQSTRSRRPIRLPARFQDSALYFSPNGDLFDVPSPPTSPRQRGRMGAASSSKVAQPQPHPPPAPATPVQPDAVQLSSSSSSSYASSSSSSSSSRSSSRSSSPCGSCCEAATSSQASSKKNDEGTKTFPINGGRTLKQLARLKTDGFVSLHSINNSQASSTPEGSVDINVDSLSDSDEELSVGDEPRAKGSFESTMQMKACRERIRRQQMQNLLMQLQNVVFRTPTTKPVSKVSVLSQANQYLRSLTVLSAHLHEEKRWLKQRRAALELCLQASCQGTQVPPLPQAEPKPAPVPASVLEVCDLSDCTVPPLREASDELLNGGSDPTSPSALPAARSTKKNGGSSSSKLHHGKKRHSSKSGFEKTSKQKAPRPEKVQGTAARAAAPAKVEAVTCKEYNMEMTTGNNDPTTVSYKVNDGHIGALRTVPAATADTPKKYTLYPAKGTMLGDLSKVAAAAQQIIGPCVIKRVKLRSGQTVYVYGQPEGANAPTADSTPPIQDRRSSGAGDEYQPLSSGALSMSTWKDEEVSTLHLAAPSALAEPDAVPSPDEEMPEVACGDDSQDTHGSSLQGIGEDQQASHGCNVDDDEGDLGDTSEWISGDGDTCIVMKLPVTTDEEESSSDES